MRSSIEEVFGPDASSSLEIDEIKELVKAVKNINISLAHPVDKNDNSRFNELKNIFEKSLAVNKDLWAGHVLSFGDLEAKKQKGYGVAASKFEEVIVKELKRNILQWEFLKRENMT
jgi:N-acetylneuraminate synthase